VHRIRRRVGDLGRNGARSGLLLHRTVDARALEPEGKVRILGAELNGALDHLLGALGVPAPQKHLAEPAIDGPVARRAFAGRHEDGLRVPEPTGLHVHARDRYEHRDIAGVPLRRDLSDLLYERRARGGAQCVAERDGRGRARVLFPAMNELVDRGLGHGG
jgi:hypothetical protein